MNPEQEIELVLDNPRSAHILRMLCHPLGARTVDPAMGPAVVQQPKHGNARRTAELIGADRVLPATPRSTKKMPVHAALLADLPEIRQGPIRDCGRMPSNPEVIHL